LARRLLLVKRMSPKRLFFSWVLAACMATGVAQAEGGVQVAPASSPPTAASWTRPALKQTVEQGLADRPSITPVGYTVFPHLLELRRYVDGDPKKPTVVCVVELTLLDERVGRIVAKTRGSANSVTASEREVLRTAAEGATSRLADTLAVLARRENNSKPVANR
jgi:hypothetical protein